MWIEPCKLEGRPNLDSYVIHHRDGRNVEFAAPGYAKATWSKVEGQMREINKYLAWVEAKNPKRIDKIFQGYIDAVNVFKDNPEPQRQLELLSRAVKKIYDNVSYEEILALCKVPGWVKLPPDLKQVWVNDDTPEKTYLRVEYIELTALVVYVRLMAPIWGEFLRDAGDIYGPVAKDDVAMLLMAKTRLHEIEAYDRMEEYIAAQSEGGKRSSLAMTVDLMSPEKIPSWLRSQAIVRRLAMHDLEGVVQCTTVNGVQVSTTHIVTLIYNYIDNLTTLRRFNGPITDKSPRFSSSSRDDDNQGVTDTVTVKDRRSPRTLRLDIAYLENITKVVTDIDPTAPTDTVVDLSERIHAGYQASIAKAKNGEVINKSVRAITQWIINEVVPARSIAAIPLVNQIKAYAVASVILDHWGFPHLAAMVAGQQIDRGDVYQVIEPMSANERKQLEALYPDAIYHDERTPMPVASINEVSHWLAKVDWNVSMLSPDLVKRAEARKDGIMACHSDIIHMLVALTVRLNEHINQKARNKGK